IVLGVMVLGAISWWWLGSRSPDKDVVTFRDPVPKATFTPASASNALTTVPEVPSSVSLSSTPSSGKTAAEELAIRKPAEPNGSLPVGPGIERPAPKVAVSPPPGNWAFQYKGATHQ